MSKPRVNVEVKTPGLVSVRPRDNGPTMRVAYLLSGRHRKASIAEELKLLCERSGFGLHFEEVDIMVGGGEHDLLDSETSAKIEARIIEGDFDLIMLSLPCATWSRANYAGGSGPKPCRSKDYPWGFPNSLRPMRERAEKGNDFIHFTIRAIEAAIASRESSGRIARVILEHPEALGTAFQEGVNVGILASIWQLPKIRVILERCQDFAIVAKH